MKIRLKINVSLKCKTMMISRRKMQCWASLVLEEKGGMVRKLLINTEQANLLLWQDLHFLEFYLCGLAISIFTEHSFSSKIKTYFRNYIINGIIFNRNKYSFFLDYIKSFVIYLSKTWPRFVFYNLVNTRLSLLSLLTKGKTFFKDWRQKHTLPNKKLVNNFQKL